MILQIGTDHTLAPLALRERLAIGGQTADAFLQRLVSEPSLDEVVMLSTCNRVELYLATTDLAVAEARVRAVLAELLGEGPTALDAVLIARRGVDAVRHLCAVAAGLQSMVVAEGQILGQVREALDRARALGVAGHHLGAVFRIAVASGKRVRAETLLGQTDSSASSVLTELLCREIDDWPAQRVLLIGAGRMNEVTGARLRALGAGAVLVTSRTHAAAARLAELVGGEAISLEALPQAAREATVIISATRSPGLMLTRQMLEGRPAGPLIVGDLAVPRDVDPAVGALPGVKLLDIDALRDMQDRRGMGEALAAANLLVEEGLTEWQTWRRTREAVPLIADLRAHVDSQKEVELSRTLRQLEHLPASDRLAVEEMAHRLVNKMFHHLAIRMKQAAADPELGDRYLEAARYLFQRDASGGHPHGRSALAEVPAVEQVATP